MRSDEPEVFIFNRYGFGFTFEKVNNMRLDERSSRFRSIAIFWMTNSLKEANTSGVFWDAIVP